MKAIRVNSGLVMVCSPVCARAMETLREGERPMRFFEKIMNRIVLAKMAKEGRASLSIIEENSRKPRTFNQELLFRLLKDNADTEYGRKYGFGEITTKEEFKERVPFSTYDDYAPYIERMIDNDERNLITAYPIVHYAVSSGSVGVPKC